MERYLTTGGTLGKGEVETAREVGKIWALKTVIEQPEEVIEELSKEKE